MELWLIINSFASSNSPWQTGLLYVAFEWDAAKIKGGSFVTEVHYKQV